MTLKKTQIALATAIALGASVVSTSASAVAIADGTYSIKILFSPEAFVPGSGVIDVGTAGGQVNTSFTFNNTPSTGSQGIINDTDPAVVNQIGGVGSGVADGQAGFGTLTVSGGVITVSDWNIDNMLGTAGGIFSQEEGTPSTWTGTTNATTTTINPVGRIGEVQQLVPTMVGAKPWDYAAMTTGAVTVTGPAGTANWSGTAVAAANLDGTADDYTLALAGAGIVGTTWTGFGGAAYIEVYSMELTRQTSAIPVPAAAYLFGSGLLGLAGVARRRRSKV